MTIAAMMTLGLQAGDVAGTWKGSKDTPMGNARHAGPTP